MGKWLLIKCLLCKFEDVFRPPASVRTRSTGHVPIILVVRDKTGGSSEFWPDSLANQWTPGLVSNPDLKNTHVHTCAYMLQTHTQTTLFKSYLSKVRGEPDEGEGLIFGENSKEKRKLEAGKDLNNCWISEGSQMTRRQLSLLSGRRKWRPSKTITLNLEGLTQQGWARGTPWCGGTSAGFGKLLGRSYLSQAFASPLTHALHLRVQAQCQGGCWIHNNTYSIRHKFLCKTPTQKCLVMGCGGRESQPPSQSSFCFPIWLQSLLPIGPLVDTQEGQSWSQWPWNCDVDDTVDHKPQENRENHLEAIRLEST